MATPCNAITIPWQLHASVCTLQVGQLTTQLDDIQSSANEASDLMEGEQLEKRELEEKLSETMVSLYSVSHSFPFHHLIYCSLTSLSPLFLFHLPSPLSLPPLPLFPPLPQAHETELTQVNEQLHMQIAEMSILARIKQTEEGEEDSDSILEKYYEARRELETLRQRVSSEFEDQIESLGSSKRSLEKKVGLSLGG